MSETKKQRRRKKRLQRGKKRFKLKQTKFLPNLVTAFGLMCGLFVIFVVVKSQESSYQLAYRMTLLLLLAGLADLLDGAIARAVKGESEFGLVFDSLADAVSFGVAPSCLVLKGLMLPEKSPFAFLALVGAMLFTLAGILRLVRFNVSSSMENRDLKGYEKAFVGLPIPSGAAAVVAINLIMQNPIITENIFHSQIIAASVLGIAEVFIAYLMLSNIIFPSLKGVHIHMPTFQGIFWATLLIILALYGLLYYLPFLLFVLAWGYITVCLVLALFRVCKR